MFYIKNLDKMRAINMRLSELKFENHPILGNLNLSFSKDNNHIYDNIVFVGENGCGKTTILKELLNYDDS